MPSKRASLIVPYHNVEGFISDCLSSIERQTMQEVEVLLVDDGSSDGSREIAEGYCRRDGRFRLHVQENAGLAAARNRGVADATGDYVMFVDSDDLLPPRAVELLVSRLDSTGSAMAIGNARRFDGFATEPSWGQLRSAATDRNATTLEAFPALAADRIACNKMFRRSFWEQRGYAFPSIRYEDYPVVLAALFDAPSIDCVSAAVYYWRRRDDGASITQRSSDVDNALDRLESAQLVLDIVDARGVDAVATEVQNLLARIDVPAVFAAFGEVAGESAVRLAHQLESLVRRLDTPAMHPSSGLLALQLHALNAGDLESLRVYARHRLETPAGDDPVRSSRRRPWRREFLYPGALDRRRPAPQRLYLVPYWQHRLSTSVEELRIADSELIIRAAARIDFTTTQPAVAVRARARGRTIDGSVDSAADGSGFVARFDLAALRDIADARWEIVVEARHRWLRRRGPLSHGDEASRPFGAISLLSERPSVRGHFDPGGRVVIDIEPGWLAATAGDVRAAVLELRAEADADVGLTLRRDDGSLVDVQRDTGIGRGHGEFEIDLTPMLDDPQAEDPVTGVATYTVVESGSGRPVLAHPDSRPVRHVVGGWMIAATRSPDGELVLERSTPEPVVDVVEVVGHGIVIAGGGALPSDLEWRATRHGGTATARIESTDGGWRAVVDGVDFARIARPAVGQLFAFVDGRPARLDGFAAATLPIRLRAGDLRVRIAVRGRTFEATPY